MYILGKAFTARKIQELNENCDIVNLTKVFFFKSNCNVTNVINTNMYIDRSIEGHAVISNDDIRLYGSKICANSCLQKAIEGTTNHI